MSNDLVVSVDQKGTLTFVYDDSLSSLLDEGKEWTIKRVSEVEPVDKSWVAFMRDGKKLGPYRLREEALRAEREYLEEKMFK